MQLRRRIEIKQQLIFDQIVPWSALDRVAK